MKLTKTQIALLEQEGRFFLALADELDERHAALAKAHLPRVNVRNIASRCRIFGKSCVSHV